MKTAFANILFFLSMILFVSGAAYSQNTQPENYIVFENVDANPEAEKPVAKIGSLIITAREYLYGYEFGPAFIKQNVDSKKRYLNFLINEKLLAANGFTQGLDKKDEFVNHFSAVHKDLTADELYKKEILTRVSVTDDEIGRGIEKKLTALNIKWLYSEDEKGIKEFNRKLKSGFSFDSLFNYQLNDSIFLDMRSWEADRFTIEKKNPLLAKIVDTLKAGSISLPVHTPDGWYIIKLENIWRTLLPTESELIKLSYDVKTAIAKTKADSAADSYIKSVMIKREPVLKKRALMILRSYIGKYALPDDKYKEWELEKKLKNLIDSLKLENRGDANNLPLVEMNSGNITIYDFMNWFRLRSENIKLDKASLKNFSFSLENLVWRMLRDELLVKAAFEQKLNESAIVKEQSRWWKDKIMYAVVRDEIGSSIKLSGELKRDMTKEENYSTELTKKILHKINELKKTVKIEVNEELLAKIKVEQENNKKAIDTYTVKQGGYFPRTAYPSIDLFWKSWE